MFQGPLCPNLSQKVQKEVSQMANRNLSPVILLGGLSVNLNHLIIEFYSFMHSAFWGWKHFENLIMCSLEDGFVRGADFQNGGKSRTLRNWSINFLLFYKNNRMLKTDIMLDYW